MRSLLASIDDLIQERQFDRAEILLRDFVPRPATSGAILETAQSLRRLCSTAAEHRRLADQLDAAATRHRVAEDQVIRRIEGLLGSLMAALEPRRPAANACSDSRTRIRPPTPITIPSIEVRMLGFLDVAIDGRHIAKWGSLKARALFQYLVFHARQPVRRESLMDVFWPRHTRDSARNNLNVSLYNLRRTLHEQRAQKYVLFAGGCYLLNPELGWWIDRDEFAATLDRARTYRRSDLRREAVDAYEHAVDLYRGPVFEDDTTSEWYLYERRHLEDLYLQALENLGELRLELDDPALAEEAAQQALGSDPCRESAHRLLMRCYARQHQHHLISRQLQICASVLRQELGITPAPETVDVFEALTNRI
jgi:DNA-binding SARP family transcriptional activator